MTDITAIILTKNEERNIERCIKSVESFVDRIVVVDSGSEDKTIEIVKKFNVEIYYHEFKHYADQFNWALKNTNITTKWVYRLDADEVVTEELGKEFTKKCMEHADDDVNGMLMKHKLYFLGKYLKHGGAYPFIKMTIFKPAFADFEDRAMGEHVVLHKGTYIQLNNDCLHHDCKNLSAFIDKHNSYATREVIDYFDRIGMNQKSLYNKAETTKKLRDNFYYRLPPFFRAKLYYIFRYYVQLGFLDGRPGKIYAFFQAYFYRYLVDAKIFESKTGDKT